MEIEVRPYDPVWPVRFDAERILLEDALSPWLLQGVHHIGSTAVPGLASKPIIDMMAGVRDLAGARAATEPLEKLGYTHAEHRPDALWFFRYSEPDWTHASYGLHLTTPGSDLWIERLGFRDALRADPDLVEEYAELKSGLAREHTHDLKAYTDSKRAFVALVLAGAGIELHDWRGE